MKHILILGLIVVPTVALAEVKSVSPSHFEIERKVVVSASPAEAYAMLGQVDKWWSGAHTYSGSAASLRMDLRAGGCFCETMADGGTIEHLRIVQARPGEVLRGQGGLGPLQSEAIAATLDWTLKAAPGGGTEITQTYVASGHARMGMEKLAALVDAVMTEQLSGLEKRLTL
jgi:hypothetical protein